MDNNKIKKSRDIYIVIFMNISIIVNVVLDVRRIIGSTFHNYLESPMTTISIGFLLIGYITFKRYLLKRQECSNTIEMIILVLVLPLLIMQFFEDYIVFNNIILLTGTLQLLIGMIYLLFSNTMRRADVIILYSHLAMYILTVIFIAIDKNIYEVYILNFEYSKAHLISIYISLLLCCFVITINCAHNKVKGNIELKKSKVFINVVKMIIIVLTFYIIINFILNYISVDKKTHESIADLQEDVYSKKEVMFLEIEDYVLAVDFYKESFSKVLYYKNGDNQLLSMTKYHDETKYMKHIHCFEYDDDILVFVNIFSHDNRFVVVISSLNRYENINVYDSYSQMNKSIFLDENIYFFYQIDKELVDEDYILTIEARNDAIYTIEGSEFDSDTPKIIRKK